MNENVVEKVKKYVEEHLREPITAAEIAKAVGYSQMNFFIEIFKNYKNVTPSKYRIASGNNFKDL